ncbi:hypothetical protein HZS_5821 [Henneguya salminicola]|nr:hypothetical protein HZS_5821 [Henneguya salminicola]
MKNPKQRLMIITNLRHNRFIHKGNFLHPDNSDIYTQNMGKLGRLIKIIKKIREEQSPIPIIYALDGNLNHKD